jgi:hypothetical protein
MSENKHVKDMRDGSHPLRRAKDYVNGQRRRKWSKPERKYRLAYRRRPFATVASTAVAIVASATIAYGSVQVASIFEGTPYENSGWAVCETPITWTVDGGAPYHNDLKWAFDQWQSASGYTFAYAGEAPTNFDNARTLVTTVAQMDNNIAVVFMRDAQSDFLTTKVVGFASPSKVWANDKQIVNGYAGFNVDYLVNAPQKERRSLFLHEIGHALGLADSDDKDNIMYRYLDGQLKFGSGDIEGLKVLVKPCVSR